MKELADYIFQDTSVFEHNVLPPRALANSKLLVMASQYQVRLIY